MHADVNEFSNFLLQLNNHRTVSKVVCAYYYCIILILKGIMNFKVKKSMHFAEQKYKLMLYTKNKTESRIENLTHSF